MIQWFIYHEAVTCVFCLVGYWTELFGTGLLKSGSSLRMTKSWRTTWPIWHGNKCLSPLKMWVEPCSWRGVLDTTLHDKVCQWLATGRWFSPGTPFSSTNKTDRNDITEILLKVALNTINPKPLELHFWTNFPIYLVWRQMYLV